MGEGHSSTHDRHEQSRRKSIWDCARLLTYVPYFITPTLTQTRTHTFQLIVNRNRLSYTSPSRSLKLKTVATLSSTIVNGTHRPAHKVLGKRMVGAGIEI
jgi:hypothetical protein